MKNLKNIPQELRELKQWCISIDGKPHKKNGIPVNRLYNGRWHTLDEILPICKKKNIQPGLIITPDDAYTCIDVSIGQIVASEQDYIDNILQAFDSYCEATKNCYRIIVRGQLKENLTIGSINTYSRDKFVVLTGNFLKDYDTINYRQSVLDSYAAKIKSIKGEWQKKEIKEAINQPPTLSIDDLHVINLASNEDNFRQLWDGKIIDCQSISDAEYDLLAILANHTDDNIQIRRLFRQSALGARGESRSDDLINAAIYRIRNNLGRFGRIPSQMIDQPDQKFIAQKYDSLSDDDINIPPGMLGELTDWFLSVSPRPVQNISIATAIAVAAGLYGRAYSVSNSGLNIYTVLIAQSGVGKEAINSCIGKLMHQMLAAGFGGFTKFFDFTDYASGPALIKSIAKSNSSFLNIYQEFGRKLRKMAEDRIEGAAASLRTVITNLYQKSGQQSIISGIGYADSEKNVSCVDGIAYSIIGETTPETFYESLTASMMQDGFLSRFLIIDHNGDRPRANRFCDYNLPKNILKNLSAGLNKISACPSGTSYPVQFDKLANNLSDEFDCYCDDQINASNVQSYRQLYNRAHLKFLKLAALLAVFDNPTKPLVNIDHAQWALKMVKSTIHQLDQKITGGDVGDGDLAREQKLLSVIRAYQLSMDIDPKHNIPPQMVSAGFIPRRYLHFKTQRVNAFCNHRLGHSASLDLSLRNMIDNGYIKEISSDNLPRDWVMMGKLYKIVNPPL